jgi:uncharacterized NAD(P)/FAD-binding protein YdhS
MTYHDKRRMNILDPNLTHARTRPTIAIIGGGFTGAAVAYNLATRPGFAFSADIVVFEPREQIGRGLAYDTAEPAHRINVPAARMSLRPDVPDDFARWLEDRGATADDPDAHRPNGDVFPRRGVFGAYVTNSVRPYLESGAIRHIRSSVRHVRHLPDGWEITDATGERLVATVLVIATTHPPPAPPRALAAALKDHPRFIPDPTQPPSLDAIRPEDDVLIVGNGLTAADVVATLERKGHRGRLLCVSRRGLRSRGHAVSAQEPFGDFLDPPVISARDLLSRVRSTIRSAQAEGLTWHAVIDRVRGQAGTFWRDLPIAERRRIIRHLRVVWDVHRFRIAPQVEQALDDAIADGRLDIRAASIIGTRIEGERIAVTLKPKGGGPQVERVFDAVAVTTGPAHGGILESQPWLGDLGTAGHLHLDPTGLGIDCDGRSRALGADERPDDTLLIAGPLARGYFGELMGLPQVSEHAVLVAESALESLARHASRHDAAEHEESFSTSA